MQNDFYFVTKVLSLYEKIMGYEEHPISDVDFSGSNMLKLCNKILNQLHNYSYIIKVNEVANFDELKELVGKTGSVVTMLFDFVDRYGCLLEERAWIL